MTSPRKCNTCGESASQERGIVGVYGGGKRYHAGCRPQQAKAATKTPTAQGISRLLKNAGFARSDYGDKGARRGGHSTGYRAYGLWRKAAAGGVERFVSVVHYTKGQWNDDDVWEEHRRSVRGWLARYAEAIEAAGFAAEVKAGKPGDDPALIVTAGED